MTAIDSPPHPRVLRVLVVANDDIDDADVAGILASGDAGPRMEVLVVTPALNSWMGRLVTDTGAAERDAEARFARSVDSLRRAGCAATGVVGDADPLLALDDILTVFDADEVVIASAREDGWLGSKLVERARAWCALPVRYAALSGCPVRELFEHAVPTAAMRPDGYGATDGNTTGSRPREHRRHTGMGRAQRPSWRGR